MTSQQPAPGWYPDPSGNPGQKYWDGQQWHDAGAAATPAAVAPYGGAPYGGAPYGGASYGVDAYGQPLSDKSKLVAGLLQLFLGSFGVGRFYLGYGTIGALQIVVTFLTCGIGAIWPLIDGIMIIMGNVPDAQGRTLRD
ncbi:MAG: NINE protein [Mycobacterium sp.]|uniref:NINE protein n=1 Tax=Mycobacterium sp. TaxID=1785 RepID=UPI001ED44051|nr:NINE protein [Mycobacterium sp.]MBW0019594.1 NINE protein [Mycobacterium sp.]